MRRSETSDLKNAVGKENGKPVVVITGGTRGIGQGLARSFLDRGASVVISGRMKQTIDDAVALLGTSTDPKRICGEVCDVRCWADVQGLWDFAVKLFGHVDIWINNAGLIRGMTAYGASKRALAYITDSLALEAKGSGVIVGAIQPGMTCASSGLQSAKPHGVS